MNHPIRLFFACSASALVFLTFAPGNTVAQTGSVIYMHTTTIDIDLPDGLEEFQQHLPESITSKYKMDFTDADALTNLHHEATETANGKLMTDFFSSGKANGHQLKIDFGGIRNNVSVTASYVDLDKGTYLEQSEFLGRTFLVTRTLPELAWKLSAEEALFLEHRVIKATAMWDTSAVEAWFTPEIPSTFGPNQFSGLPGLILMLSIDKGKQLYEAQEITLDVTHDLSPPQEGRRVTEEEFNAIVEEKLRERQHKSTPNFKIFIKSQ